MDNEIVAYLVQGFDHRMDVIARNIFIDLDDAKSLAKSFVDHYETVRITALVPLSHEATK